MLTYMENGLRGRVSATQRSSWFGGRSPRRGALLGRKQNMLRSLRVIAGGGGRYQRRRTVQWRRVNGRGWPCGGRDD